MLFIVSFAETDILKSFGRKVNMETGYFDTLLCKKDI